MNYVTELLNAAVTMEPLLKNEEGNWEHRFCFLDGKAGVYYIAKDPSQCHSGYFGDVAHIKRLTRTLTVHGTPVLDENNLTDKGKLLLQANGDQILYEKLLNCHVGKDVKCSA